MITNKITITIDIKEDEIMSSKWKAKEPISMEEWTNIIHSFVNTEIERMAEGDYMFTEAVLSN